MNKGEEFNNLSTNNTQTSDELDAPISYGYDLPVRETNFARLKKPIKKVKMAALTVTVTVTGGSIIFLIKNNVVPKEIPQIANYSVEIDERKLLSYSADISNVSKYYVYFELFKGEQSLHKDTYSQNGHIQKEYDLSTYSGEITALLGYGNGADYYVNIKTDKFII